MSNQLKTRFIIKAEPSNEQSNEQSNQDGWGHAMLTQAGSEALVRLLKPLRSNEDPVLRDVAAALVGMLDQAGLDTKSL